MGTSWISKKGGILEKGGAGFDLEKGGVTPVTNYGREKVHWGKMASD